MNSHAYKSNSFTEDNGTGSGNGKKTTLVVTTNTHRPVQKISGMRGVITASVLLLIITGSYIYIMHNTGRKLNAGKNRSIPPVIDKPDVKSKSAEVIIQREDPPSNKINIKTPQVNDSATINIYRDPALSKILILIKDLPKSPPGQQYQLWAVIKGKHHSLGMFDASENDFLILDMNKVNQADSFLITINKTGNPVEQDSIAVPATKKGF